jgi:hypothetical protein
MVLVDTSVWSLALRRSTRADTVHRRELVELIEEGRAAVLGPVRQEILSGVKEAGQFERLRRELRAFPDVELSTSDYEEAARFFNRCRSRGVQGSNIDFLICAAGARLEMPILTTDADFRRYAELLPIALHEPR